MDTSGLASGLSLAAFLTVFGYLSILEMASSPGTGFLWPPYQASRLQFTLKFLKLATVVAVVLSAQAVVLSQGDHSVGLVALLSVALVALLVAMDRGSRLLSARFPTLVTTVALPGIAALVRLVRFPRRRMERLWRSRETVEIATGRNKRRRTPPPWSSPRKSRQ